jgi:hypothetical protein
VTPTATERWLARAAITAILVALACDDPEVAFPFLAHEDFETPCDDGLPCGFVQTEGSPDQATFAETSFHPGEHGIVLRGSGVTVRGTGDDPGKVVTFTFGSLEARVIGRCDEGSFVDLSLGVAELVDGEATGRVDETAPVALDIGTTWSSGTSPSVVTLSTAPLDGGIGSGFSNEVRVTGIVLRKRGTGTCEIAEIIVDQLNGTTRSPGTRC